MCAFEEEINYKKPQKKPHMIKVLFSGRYFSDKLNETMEIVFLLQCNLYRKKYEKYNNIHLLTGYEGRALLLSPRYQLLSEARPRTIVYTEGTIL